MANNYQETSSFLPIPSEKIDSARSICDRVESKILSSADDCGDPIEYIDCQYEIQDDGIWFRSDESFNPEHVEMFARSLVEELDLEGSFMCSWCYLCSKPRVDEFGGGAFILAKGMPTHWVDAQYECIKAYEAFSKTREG